MTNRGDRASPRTSNKRGGGETGGRRSVRGKVELSTAIVGFATAVVSLIVAFHSTGNAQSATSKAQSAQQQLDQANNKIQQLQSQLAKAQASPAAAQPGSGSPSSGGTTSSTPPDFVKNLNMPGPSPGPYENAIDIDEGQIIINGVGAASLSYKQRTADSYELDVNMGEGSTAAVLAATDPSPTSAAQCEQDVQSEPFSSQRDLPKGLRICVNSGFGIAFIVITKAPDSSGAFSLKETYWKSS